ncbi:MAG: carboxypeptidase regulatory-like domain-containing protein, partial [Acidobacteria bacterium]|nr:carboxypeptidase regulatory-like domain-containing protein [Acidobacteriota bacterium]
MTHLVTYRSPGAAKLAAVTLSILALLGLFSVTALAQRGRGTILGSVTDSNGAVVPGAIVTITNTATNVTTSAVTNDDGNYVAPNLNVGGYSVAVTKQGFKKALRSGITLEVDQRAEINLTLETGAVSETVEVTSQVPLVDTTTATFGKVIENRRVEELPVNGRNALSLVLLAPAVQSGVGPTASGFADRGTQISFIRINGSPFASNNLVVDGLSSVNAYVPDVNI